VKRITQPATIHAQKIKYNNILVPKDRIKETENLNRTMLNCIGAGAGVSEPGLNRWPDKNNLPLRYGGGLKILWRRPSWVQVPPPAPLIINKVLMDCSWMFTLDCCIMIHKETFRYILTS